MHIKDDLINGDDSEFFTPKHAPSAVTSSVNIAASQSQDSVDIFHDAHSMINNHCGSNISINQRRRHASMPQHAFRSRPLANGVLTEHDASLNHKEPKSRVRHFSCSTTNHSSPNHVPRLSSSTNSVGRPIPDTNGICFDPPDCDSLIKIPPPPSVPKLSPLKLVNYISCQDVVDSKQLNSEPFRNNLSPVIESKDVVEMSSSEEMEKKALSKRSSPGAWMRNYVMCVETEGMLRDEGSQFCNEETCLKEDQDPPDDHAMVHMYSFDPVKRQRKPNFRKIREEFSLSHLNLEHNAPHLFVSSQWQQPSQLSCLYLGYRLFWAMYFLMWGLWSWNGSMGYGAPFSLQVYYLLYMTNWGLWTLVLDTNLQALNTILHFRKIAYEGDPRYRSMKKMLKVSWVLSNTTSSIHLFITAAYWITVYPLRTGELVSLLQRPDQSINEIGINVHLIPGIYVLLDVMVAATPRRLLHAYHPMGFIITYYIFNFTYFMAGGLDYLGGPSLYPALDWTKPVPTVAIMIGSIFILTPLYHALICGLYALRIKIWRILKLTRYTREDDELEKVPTNPQSLDV